MIAIIVIAVFAGLLDRDDVLSGEGGAAEFGLQLSRNFHQDAGDDFARREDSQKVLSVEAQFQIHDAVAAARGALVT